MCLCNKARIPVPTPPPLDSLSTPLLIFSFCDSHLREPRSLREISHASPSIKHWICCLHNAQRHFRGQKWPERALKPGNQARESTGSPSHKYILAANMSSRLHIDKFKMQRTFTNRPFSLSEKPARTLCRTSPIPAESTPAIPGENHASHTRHRSVFRCILV